MGILLSLFPNVSKSSSYFDAIYKTMTDIVQKIFYLNVSDIMDFYVLKGYLIMSLIGSIYVARLASGITAI
ncbi:MAG: hypothetical protein J7K51_05390 [Thermotogae bacterium]|nr:hypothetical protein [Thermotogota bacterium]